MQLDDIPLVDFIPLNTGKLPIMKYLGSTMLSCRSGLALRGLLR